MNYNSFQAVMDNATHEGTKTSLQVGKRKVVIVHDGTLNAKGAQQFHDMVRAEYERQESERDTTSSKTATPTSPDNRERTDASQYRGGATSIEGVRKEAKVPQSIQDIIQTQYNKQLELVERLEYEYKQVKEDKDKALEELKRINAALNAVGVVDAGK